jgi:hypothetical protein
MKLGGTDVGKVLISSSSTLIKHIIGKASNQYALIARARQHAEHMRQIHHNQNCENTAQD